MIRHYEIGGAENVRPESPTGESGFFDPYREPGFQEAVKRLLKGPSERTPRPTGMWSDQWQGYVIPVWSGRDGWVSPLVSDSDKVAELVARAPRQMLPWREGHGDTDEAVEVEFDDPLDAVYRDILAFHYGLLSGRYRLVSKSDAPGFVLVEVVKGPPEPEAEGGVPGGKDEDMADAPLPSPFAE